MVNSVWPASDLDSVNPCVLCWMFKPRFFGTSLIARRTRMRP